MNPGRDDVTRDEALLRHWDGVTARTARPPLSDLLARNRRTTGRRGQFVAGAAALLVLAVATAGVGAWISFRNGPIGGGSANPSSTSSSTSAPTATESSIASKAPTATPKPSAPSVALRQYESIVEVHLIGAGGWVLTDQRLLISDGLSWRQCLDRPSPGSDSGRNQPPGAVPPVLQDPLRAAVVDGATVRVFDSSSMAQSTDGCATWTEDRLPSDLPLGPTGVSFASAEVGYIAANLGPNYLLARVYLTDDGGAHWAALPTVKSPTPMLPGNVKLAFADAAHGWLTDGLTLWYTSNGAHSWTVTHLPVPASVTGFADTIQTPVIGPAGEATVIAKYDRAPGMDGVPGQLVFYHTVDMGAHWTAAAVIADPGMLMTAVVNSTTWVVADPETGSSVQATIDGGKTWQSTTVSNGWQLRASSMSFADSSRGWMIVNDPEPPCPQPSAGFRICDYAFAPPQHLVATDDGGATWHMVLP
jgi:hypothetical protein